MLLVASHKLTAVLTQYHQRLMILDEQIHHLDAQSLANLGQWLLRRWNKCIARKIEAEVTLSDVGIDKRVLEEQWKAQVQTQTRPAPRM